MSPVTVQTIKQLRELKEKFGIFGGFRLQLDETVVPVAIVEDITRDIDSIDVPCFAGQDRAAVAAEYSHVSLYNPPDSGLLVIVDEIWVSANPTNFVQLRSGARAGTTVNPSFRDSRAWSRASIPQVPQTRLMHHTNALVLGDLRVGPLLATTGESSIFRPDITLAENEDISIVSITVNQALRVVFMFRERTGGV